MGGKPAIFLAGQALTSTQIVWAAETCGTPYQLFYVLDPCACQPLEGRISGFMSTWNTLRGFPCDSHMETRAEPAHSEADNLLRDYAMNTAKKPL
jgi:hypothetical protein